MSECKCCSDIGISLIHGNMRRYEWLKRSKFNQLSLGRNEDHACNYTTAEKWIKANEKEFDECDPVEIQKMKETDTIWCLRIYPITPIGSYRFYGATMDSVIDAAMCCQELMERGNV